MVQIGRGKGTRRTHIVVYEAIIGPLPEGMTFDHLCANTRCCRPSHLEIVTRAENTRRQWAAGRANAGIRNTEKTHCRHGHPFDEANTRIYKGRRHCRACAQENTRRSRASSRTGAPVVDASEPVD